LYTDMEGFRKMQLMVPQFQWCRSQKP